MKSLYSEFDEDIIRLFELKKKKNTKKLEEEKEKKYMFFQIKFSDLENIRRKSNKTWWSAYNPVCITKVW